MSTLSLKYDSNTMESYDVSSNNTYLGRICMFKSMNDYRSHGTVIVDDVYYDWKKGWFGGVTVDPICPNKKEFEDVIGKFPINNYL